MRRAACALAMVSALALGGSALAAPEQIHLSWQGPTDTTMTVTWRSSESRGEVWYGRDGYHERQPAQTVAYDGSYLHTAELTGLEPGTSYRYRVGVDGSWSADRAFTTGPQKLAGYTYRFAAYGDSREDMSALGRVSAGALGRGAAFVVFTGDMVQKGSKQDAWNEWFSTMEPVASLSPVMGALGNHEGDAAQYYAQFAFPAAAGAGEKAEKYYSFDYGNTHFVALFTEPLDEAQLEWLEQDLARASSDPAIRWIVAFGHSPAYSSGKHGGDAEVRAALEPLFARYGVDAAFFGHDHHYERSLPIREGEVVEEGGTVHFVTGGAGAPLREVKGGELTAHAAAVFHGVDVIVTDTTMTFETYDDEGNRIDTYTLTNGEPVVVPQGPPVETAPEVAPGPASPSSGPGALGAGGAGCSSAGVGGLLGLAALPAVAGAASLARKVRARR